MRKMLAIAAAAVAMLATLTLSAAPASATSVHFLLPHLTASAAAPTSVCEPATTGVVGRGTWTKVVTALSTTHTPTFTLQAVCFRGTNVEVYDFTIKGDGNESCYEGQAGLSVTATGPKAKTYTGSGSMAKAAGVFHLLFRITPSDDGSKSYDVAFELFRDPASGTGVPCNYTSLNLVGHGAIAYV